MNIFDYDNLSYKEQRIILEYSLKLVTLTHEYPIDYNNLEIFTKWHEKLGFFGKDLKELLYGVYPQSEFFSNKHERLRISNKAFNFVKYWNQIVKNQTNLNGFLNNEDNNTHTNNVFNIKLDINQIKKDAGKISNNKLQNQQSGIVNLNEGSGISIKFFTKEKNSKD